MNPTIQFCTFRLNGHLFGIDVRQVQEVLREVAITPVPLAASAVSGLFSLRGKNVAAVDLRRCLGFPDRSEECPPVSLIVQTSIGLIGLLADSIGDVLEPDPSEFESTPDSGCAEARQITGVYKLPQTLLRVLDLSLTVEEVMSRRLDHVHLEAARDAGPIANSPAAGR